VDHAAYLSLACVDRGYPCRSIFWRFLMTRFCLVMLP
jgi:hypothetical protein